MYVQFCWSQKHASWLKILWELRARTTMPWASTAMMMACNGAPKFVKRGPWRSLCREGNPGGPGTDLELELLEIILSSGVMFDGIDPKKNTGLEWSWFVIPDWSKKIRYASAAAGPDDVDEAWKPGGGHMPCIDRRKINWHNAYGNSMHRQDLRLGESGRAIFWSIGCTWLSHVSPFVLFLAARTMIRSRRANAS